MVSLHPPSWEKEPGMLDEKEEVEEEQKEEEEEEEGETVDKEDSGGEASATDDSEQEWDTERDVPSVIRRKVSFADAFGLDLVSVKEFDAAIDPLRSRINDDDDNDDGDSPPSRKVVPPLAQAENHLSCLFSVPSGPEELRQRLREQKVELESIELLPGTATLRGVVRVTNLCYHKSVYVRLSPDAWRSHFELPAFYVPGSSDRETDRFAFIQAMEPPVHGKGGTRVEFCLRYETEVGTFWANNRGLNYVLFCHQKAPKCVNLNTEETKECAVLQHLLKHLKGGQRSCLKANSRGDAEDRTYEVTDRSTARETKAETTGRSKVDPTEILQDGTPLIDSEKGRRKAAQLCRLKPLLGDHRHPEQPRASAEPRPSHHPPKRHHQATPATGGFSEGSPVGVLNPKQPAEVPLCQPTYHQIPLLTLDWRGTDPQGRAAPEGEELWGGGTFKNLGSKASTEGDPGQAKDDSSISVCDIWQSFIRDDKGPDHSGLPESLWLQRAAATPPSEQPVPEAVVAATWEQNHPTAACEGRPVSVSPGDCLAGRPNPRVTQPAGMWVRSSDKDPVTPEGRSGKDARQEEVPFGTREVSVTPYGNDHNGDSNTGSEDDGGARRTKCVSPETRDTEGIRGRGGRRDEGGDGGVREPLGTFVGERITSSGERGTTEMTEAAEPQNARSFDRIWPGAGPGDGLSPSSGVEEEEEEEEKGEVMSIARGSERDTLAFREAFKGQGTKDGTGSVLSPFTRGGSAGGRGGGGAEEARLTMHDTEGEGYTAEEIFRPRAAVNTECSQREAGDKDCGGSGPNKKSGTALKHKRTHHGDVGLHANAFNADELCTHDTNPTQSQMNANHLEQDTSEIADATLDGTRPERNKVGGSQHGTSDGLKDEDAKVDLQREIKEEKDLLPHNENPFPQNSFETDPGKEEEGLASTCSEAHDHRLEPLVPDEGPRVQSQALGLNVLTGERPSTAPRSSASSGKEEGAGEDNDAKPSTLKQEPCGETDIDEMSITHTPAHTQGELLSDGPSLKSPEDETGAKGDGGKGVEIQQFQTDERESGPSEATDSESKKGIQQNVKSEERDECVASGIAPPDDIFFRVTFEATSGTPGGPRHQPELGEGEERDGNGGRRGIQKGQRVAIANEWRMEKGPTPGGMEAREVSARVDGSEPLERQRRTEDAVVVAEDAVSFERLTRQGEDVAIFTDGIGEGSDKGVPEEVLNWKGVVGGSRDGKVVSRDVSPGVKEENVTSEVYSATHSPEGPKCRTTINQGIGHDLFTSESCPIESCEPVNIVETIGFIELQGDLNSPACLKENLHKISIRENNQPNTTQSRKPIAKTMQNCQSSDQTKNVMPEENELITEPCGALWLRKTHASSKEKNRETLYKQNDRGNSYNEPFNQLQDLTAGHQKKLNHSTAFCQDPVNYPPQKRWCSAFHSPLPVTNIQFWAILVALLFILVLLLMVSQNTFFCTYFPYACILFSGEGSGQRC